MVCVGLGKPWPPANVSVNHTCQELFSIGRVRTVKNLASSHDACLQRDMVDESSLELKKPFWYGQQMDLVSREASCSPCFRDSDVDAGHSARQGFGLIHRPKSRGCLRIGDALKWHVVFILIDNGTLRGLAGWERFAPREERPAHGSLALRASNLPSRSPSLR
jgi:hypothetical protein